MVSSSDVFKEVWLSARAVNGLLQINKKPNGNQKDAVKNDSTFLMALLVGFCTVKKLKESSSVEVGVLDLIKGTFCHSYQQKIMNSNYFSMYDN